MVKLNMFYGRFVTLLASVGYISCELKQGQISYQLKEAAQHVFLRCKKKMNRKCSKKMEKSFKRILVTMTGLQISRFCAENR